MNWVCTSSRLSNRAGRAGVVLRGSIVLIAGLFMAVAVEGVGQPAGDGPRRVENPVGPWHDRDGDGLLGPAGADGRDRADDGGDDWHGFDDEDGRGEGWHGRRGGRRPMTEAEAREAYAVIEELRPDLIDHVHQLREGDHRRFGELIDRRFPAVRYLVDLKRDDPAVYDLRIRDLRLTRETRDLARRVRDANGADREDDADDLTEELEERVAEHFDVRQSLRERELERLRERLEAMEEELDERSDDRGDLIEERVDALVGEGDGPRF